MAINKNIIDVIVSLFVNNNIIAITTKGKTKGTICDIDRPFIISFIKLKLASNIKTYKFISLTEPPTSGRDLNFFFCDKWLYK